MRKKTDIDVEDGVVTDIIEDEPRRGEDIDDGDYDIAGADEAAELMQLKDVEVGDIPSDGGGEEVARKIGNSMRAKDRQLPHGMSVPTEEQRLALIDKHSKRGGLAMEFIKSIVSRRPITGQVDGIVAKSFEMADAVQAEVDRAFNDELAKL